MSDFESIAWELAGDIAEEPDSAQRHEIAGTLERFAQQIIWECMAEINREWQRRQP